MKEQWILYKQKFFPCSAAATSKFDVKFYLHKQNLMECPANMWKNKRATRRNSQLEESSRTNPYYFLVIINMKLKTIFPMVTTAFLLFQEKMHSIFTNCLSVKISGLKH